MRRAIQSNSLFIAVLMLFGTTSGTANAMLVSTGSFVGTGSSGLAVSGLDFAPEVVIIAANQGGVIRSSTMTGGSKSLSANQTLLGARILSLDADGFTVGNHVSVNQSGVTSHWIAFGDVDDGFAVGTYVGDGVTTSIDISDTSSSLDFQSDYLILVSENLLAPAQALEDGSSFTSPGFGFTGTFAVGGAVSDLTASGFDVDTGARTNDLGTRYHYIAWRERTGTEVGSYVGDGAPGDLAVAVPFQPDFVSVSRIAAGVQSRYRLDTHAASQSFFWGSAGPTLDAITSFTPAGGFVVGDSGDVNTSQTHMFVAFRKALPVPMLSATGLTLLVLAMGVTALIAQRRLRERTLSAARAAPERLRL